MKQQIQQNQEKILQGYDREIPPDQIQQQQNINDEKSQKEEIPNEYNDIMQQQNSQNHGKSTPYDVKMNNFINQQNYHNSNEQPKIEYQKDIYKTNNDNNNLMNKENKVPQGQISEQEYKDYLLSQQKDKEKEKEDENMEIYQNMLKEQQKEKEKSENNPEKEQYLQYLLSKQNQSENQIMENPQYQEIYEKKPEIKENIIPQRDMMNQYNNQPINSFDDYYKQKGMNIPESQQQPQLSNQEINENKYQNFQNYPKEAQIQNQFLPQDQGFDEQAYLMYQKQKQMQEMQEMEERERAKQILERQQMEKMNINNLNNINEFSPQNEYYPQISPYNIPERKSEYNSAKMEYLQNKQKNMLSKDNIFSVSEIPKPPPKYNDQPLTNKDRLRIQREYAQFLDAQINAKLMKNSKTKNNGLGNIQSSGYEVGGPNPYQQLRDKHNKLKDIPQDPYSTKNYNISNNSYLTSNPITNPVNSYKFVVRRRVSSGRLQNSGSNVVGN